MSSFPAEPVSSREFIEEVVPSLFADVALGETEEAIDLKVGVVLRAEEGGDQGGEWTLHFIGGEIGITDGREDACQISFVLSVADWRAALWERRPVLVAEAIESVLESGPNAWRPPAEPGGGVRLDPLKGISDLAGLIEGVIGSEAGGDWRLGAQVGPGPLPETPQATIRLGAEQAEAIRDGSLHPLEALITGQLQLDGDLGLILQLQAVAMTLSMAGGGRR
ncbi:MAG: SCP2 sterol-binding domain-containing protein [bacterium]|nr:SCP2 sterol-binding domain-containing protein [bacterium]